MTTVFRQKTASEEERLLMLAIHVAAEMLKNGGETYRAEECARRILEAGGAQDVQVFAIPTSVLITASYETETLTRSVSVKSRDINLQAIDTLNTISRRVSAREMTAEEAFALLEKPEKPLRFLLLGLFSSLSSGAFSVIYGGAALDFCFGFVAAAVTNLVLKLCKRSIGFGFLSALTGSMITATLARLISWLIPSCSISSVIIGGIMPMLPGLALTNAVRDTINGDIVSGSSKATEAVLQAIAIAAGVGIVLSVQIGGNA